MLELDHIGFVEDEAMERVYVPMRRRRGLSEIALIDALYARGFYRER